MERLPFDRTRIFLFDGLSDDLTRSLLSKASPRIGGYAKGERLFDGENPTEIGFILNGSATVFRHRQDGKDIPLNRLCAGDSFGVLRMFSDAEGFRTYAVATVPTEVLFLGKTDVERLIRKCPDVAMNLIRFLAGRVTFLGQKVTTLSGADAEDRLRSFLLAEYRRRASAVIPLNFCRTADAVCMGRASLYRVLQRLETLGIIRTEKGKIILLNPEALIRKETPAVSSIERKVEK